jgi:flagellar hook assembly protein FlgD
MISYYCYQPVKRVTIDILSLSGKLVASLESPSSSRDEGWNKVRWDVTDNQGKPLKNGLYIYKIKFQTANNEAEVKGFNLMVKR